MLIISPLESRRSISAYSIQILDYVVVSDENFRVVLPLDLVEILAHETSFMPF